MKKMKLMLAVAMLVIATAASAQMSLGIKGGLNMSNIAGKNIKDNNMKLGFHAGLAADYEFMPDMAIQTGLFFTTKGFQYETTGLKYTENLMYLQLPVHFAYKQAITSETRIVFHAGPYAAYGVAGKRSLKIGSLEGSGSKIFGEGLLQYKPFDAGLGLGVGAEFGDFLLDLGWDMGLVNMSNVSGNTVKNQNAYLSVGYRF